MTKLRDSAPSLPPASADGTSADGTSADGDVGAGAGAGAKNSVPHVPQGLAGYMRPAATSLTAEIADEIARQIVRYGPGSGDEVTVASTRLTITQAIGYFIDHISDPTVPRTQLDETLRRLGRGEAYGGRSMDSLREAFDIGAKLAWRRLNDMVASQGLDTDTLGTIGTELYEFMDSLSAQAQAGYKEGLNQLSEATQQWRGRMLDLILAGSIARSSEFAALTARGNWQPPKEVVLVAVDGDPRIPMPAARLLPSSVLALLHIDEPCLLVRAPLTAEMRHELELLFQGHRLFYGCPTPLADARTSLRWARRAIELADAGIIAEPGHIDCTHYIGILWIHAEPLLADIVNRTLLAPLYAETPHSRKILGETLLMWIETTRGSAPVIGELLGKHPQTIRYRLKRLRDILGDTLDDPNRVMEMYYALRASGHLWNDGKPAPPPPVGPRGPRLEPAADGEATDSAES